MKYNQDFDLIDEIQKLRGRLEVLERVPRAVNTTVDTGNFVVGDPAGQNVTLSNASLTLNRLSNDGRQYPAWQIGGSDGDQFQIVDASGNVLGGFDSEGNFVAQVVQVSDAITVGGLDITSLIDRRPFGIIAGARMGGGHAVNNVRAGNSELGVVEVAANLAEGRQYRIVFDGHMTCTNTSVMQCRLRYTTASGLDSTPSTPRISSSQLNANTESLTANVLKRVHFETVMSTSSNMTARFLLTISNTTATYSTGVSTSGSSPAYFYVEDIGTSTTDMDDGLVNTGGGSPYTGSTPVIPPAQKKAYTKTYDASWTRSWRGSTIVTDTLQQGRYGGYQRYSMIGIPASLFSDVAGSSISKIEVYMTNKSWWYGSGGKAIIGFHDNGSAPTNPDISSPSFTTSTWKTGLGQWVTIPSRFYADIKSKDIRGITLGYNAGSNGTYYGKFSNDVRFRATYTK